MGQPKLGMRVASVDDEARLLPDTIRSEVEFATAEGYDVVFFVDETLNQITLGKMINTVDSTYDTFHVSRDHTGDVKITFDGNWRPCDGGDRPRTQVDDRPFL